MCQSNSQNTPQVWALLSLLPDSTLTSACPPWSYYLQSFIPLVHSLYCLHKEFLKIEIRTVSGLKAFNGNPLKLNSRSLSTPWSWAWSATCSPLQLVSCLSAVPSPNSSHRACLLSVPWMLQAFSLRTFPFAISCAQTAFSLCWFFGFFSNVNPDFFSNSNWNLSLSKSKPSQNTKMESAPLMFFLKHSVLLHATSHNVFLHAYSVNDCRFQKNREHICFVQHQMWKSRHSVWSQNGLNNYLLYEWS